MGQYVILPDPQKPDTTCHVMAVMGDEVVHVFNVTASRDVPGGMIASPRTAARLLAAALARGEEPAPSFTEQHPRQPPLPRSAAGLSEAQAEAAMPAMVAAMGGDTIRT